MSYESFLSRLDKVKPIGKDRWKACCPAHNDRSPSLYVAVGREDRILVDCKAGCRPAEVVSAMGLRWSDLFAEGSTPPKPQGPTTDDYVVAIAEAAKARGERLNRTDLARYKQAKLAIARR